MHGLTSEQYLEVVLEKLLLRLAYGGAVLTDNDRVHIAHPKEETLFRTVSAHHLTTPPTVVLGRERQPLRQGAQIWRSKVMATFPPSTTHSSVCECEGSGTLVTHWALRKGQETCECLTVTT